MRLYAIGDIHGCRDELNDLVWRRIIPTPDDTLVFLGDYVDRGPHSREVIDFLIGLSDWCTCIFLRGNHDQMMLDARSMERSAWDLWRRNGGDATVQSYGDRWLKSVPAEHWSFLEKTKLYHETPDFFFVHAGLVPHLSIAQNKLLPGRKNVMLWTRDHLQARDLAWEKPVVCGHTIQPAPLNLPLLICIDTGSFLCHWTGRSDGYLTAVRLPERTFISSTDQTREDAA